MASFILAQCSHRHAGCDRIASPWELTKYSRLFRFIKTCLIVSILLTGTLLAQKKHAPVFKRSDAAILGHSSDILKWAQYKPDLMVWGRDMAYPIGDGEKHAQAEIELANRTGLSLVATNVDMITATGYQMYFDKALQKASVRDVKNEPILVPWFSDRFYKGVPTYWNCTNHPIFREHIRRKVTAGIEMGANTLHLDDARGSGRFISGGCFCNFCIRGFRGYLSQNYTESELLALGIEILETYNYRQELNQIYPTKGDFIEEYGSNRDRIPLIDDYEHFHYEAVSEFIGELDSLADAVAGMPIYMTINAFSLTPRRIVAMDHIDFFTTETHQLSYNGGEAVFVYKFADALNMSLALTAGPSEWGYVKSNAASNLVKLWMSRAYAFGHHFMGPFSQWVFIEGLQSATYTGPTAEFSTVFDFVHCNASLFDGYEPIEQYGLVYTHESLRRGNESVYDIAGALYRRNIPFGAIIAGNKWLEKTFTEQDLAQYEKIILPTAPTHLDSAQSVIITGWREQGKVIDWHNDEHYENKTAPMLSPWVSLRGGLDVDVVPRVKPDDSEAPIVIHLVNRNFDPATNAIQEQQDLVVRVDSVLLDRRDITTASYLRYNGPPEELPIEADSAGISITVPSLEIWGILAL